MAGATLNRVMLIGRLTRDPELKYTPGGNGVCNMSIATNRYGKDPVTGESKELTDFHDIVVWNSPNRKLADLCGQYLTKGRQVYVEGRLQTRNWDDKDTGVKRYKTEVNATDVQFLGNKADEQGGGTGQFSGAPVGAGAAVGAGAPADGGDIDPDDIPF